MRILEACIFSESRDDVNKVQNPVLKGNHLIVKCGKGRLGIVLLQVEGKLPVNAKEFVNGYKANCFFLNDKKN